MTRGPVPNLTAIAWSWIGSLRRLSSKIGFAGFAAVTLTLLLAVASLPLMAQGTITFGTQSTPANTEDFGQYLADHQDDLAPFSSRTPEIFCGFPYRC